MFLQDNWTQLAQFSIAKANLLPIYGPQKNMTTAAGINLALNRKKFLTFNFNPTVLNISGHIKEALGTHGHMKVVMDKPISQQDTILMNLYKRVYPKWNYDPNVTRYVPEIKTKAKSSQEEIMDIM